MTARRPHRHGWGGDSPKEREAARLLGAARGYQPAVRGTWADVQAAVKASTRWDVRLPARLVVAGAIALGLVLVTGSVALSRVFLWRARHEPAAPTVIMVPARATTRIERPGHFRLSLQGPGSVAIPEDGRALRLDQGSLVLESESRAVVVEASGRRVEVPPSSSAALEAPSPGALRVSALSGAEPRIDGGRSAGGRMPVAPPPAAAAPALTTPLAPRAPPAPAAAADVAPGAAALPPATATASRAAIAAPRAVRVGRASAPTEVTAMRDALERLRRDQDAAGALRLLDDHDRRYPEGLLREEAAVIRIEALLALGRSAEALQRIEALPAAWIQASARLRVARGELRAAHDRCEEALPDFEAALSRSTDAEIAERAARGRATCRWQRGRIDTPP